MKKRILVIGTGGTIASKQSKEGLIPLMSTEEILSHVPSVSDFAEIDSLQVANLDSTDIVPADWLNFANAIKDNYEKYDGFVITHGTDTLAYTASSLSYLIQNSNKPIVITGAQKPIDAEDTDARINLRDSILYASDPESSGVVIVFDGKVIAGTRAKKERSKSYAAFTSINFPYLAVISDQKIIRYITSPKTEEAPTFADTISDNVFTLKMTPGFSSSMLKVLFENYDCIIIESFGVGGIPTYLMNEFETLMDSHNTLIIVSTQVISEGSDMSVYRVGHNVKEDYDLLETYDMTPEAAFSKACWLLGRSDLSRSEIKKEFYRPINYDITAL